MDRATKVGLCISQAGLMAGVGYMLQAISPWFWIVPAPMIVLWIITAAAEFDTKISRNLYRGP